MTRYNTARRDVTWLPPACASLRDALFGCAVSCHVGHVPSCHLCRVVSCHVMSCHVMSCHVMSCHGMAWHGMAWHGMSCHVTSPSWTGRPARGEHTVQWTCWHLICFWRPLGVISLCRVVSLSVAGCPDPPST